MDPMGLKKKTLEKNIRSDSGAEGMFRQTTVGEHGSNGSGVTWAPNQLVEGWMGWRLKVEGWMGFFPTRKRMECSGFVVETVVATQGFFVIFTRILGEMIQFD